MAGIHNTGTRSKPRTDIQDALREYEPRDEILIADLVLPPYNSDTEDGEFPGFTRETILGASNDRLALAKGSAYDRKGAELRLFDYKCKKYGQEFVIPIEDIATWSDQVRIENALSEFNYMQMLRAKEARVAAKVFDPTTWTGAPLFTDNSSNPWSTVGTDILGQVAAAKELVRSNCGMNPNALIIGRGQVINLQKNTAIKAAIQYTDGNLIPEDALIGKLSEYFQVRVMIGNSVKNTAKRGQTFAAGDVWSSTYAMLAVLCDPDPNSLVSPGIGRAPLWTFDGGAPVEVRQYYEEQTETWVYPVKHYTDEVIFEPQFGHLMQIAA